MWNLFSQLTTVETRLEILDWYHLKENLYKVGGSLKRLAAAATLLWQGQVEAAWRSSPTIGASKPAILKPI
ncbi:hypothetical protein GFS31_32470 [Leptolyngbya sp. BL0902]|nr:hypothetical protein GFS31_32470 [Leptolyngbya sp. BL0902]